MDAHRCTGEPGDDERWDSLWHDSPEIWFESGRFLEVLLERCAELAELRAPILDVGCGRGTLGALLRSGMGHSVLGVDFSHVSLRQCAVPAVQADCRLLPFGPETFAAITSILVIEHVAQYSQFLAEAFRVLRPGGTVYLLFPNFYSAVTPAVWIERSLLRSAAIPYHVTLRPRDVVHVLCDVGFTVLGRDYIAIGRFLQDRASRAILSLLNCLLPSCMHEETLLVARKD